MTAVPPRPAPGRPPRARARGPRPLARARDLREVRGPQRGRRRAGPSTRARRPPTAGPAPTTSRRASFKDVFPRFKTMQGYQVDRKAGWDCHGLPVELAVEKELGFSGKADIEAFGIAEFNATCRESVLRHVDLWEEMTERMGYWVDMRAALPDDGPRVRRVGLVGAQADPRQGPARRGLPRRAVLPALRHRPVRPRARAGLRDGHRPLGLRPLPADLAARTPARRALLVWTTTPWTLVSNTAVAVHPDVTYVVATDGERDAGRRRAAARARCSARAGRSSDRFSGADMERWTYQRPFELVEFPPRRDGTPAALRRARRLRHHRGRHRAGAPVPRVRRGRHAGLPRLRPAGRQPGRPDGHFDDDVPLVGGQFFKHADADLVDGPRARAGCCSGTCPTSTPTRTAGAATPAASTTPSRPGTSAPPQSRTRCSARTRRPTGSPTTIKYGRYGDWLNNNIDWALSRSRYWGTPLPIWRCDEGHQTCVGSLAELSELTGTDQSGLDPHRPFVDDVTFACPDVRRARRAGCPR